MDDKNGLLTKRIRRRELIGNATKMALAVTLFDSALQPLVAPALRPKSGQVDRPVRFGTTFSPLKAWYMGLDYQDAFRQILSLDLDFIRLGAYWSEIELKKGDIGNFGHLDWLLNEVEKRGRTRVILTMGIKAPVYPEFHFPAWVQSEMEIPTVGIVSNKLRLREYGFRFVRTVMERYRNAMVVNCIQVENEPFDPVLYDNKSYAFLGDDFVREEINLVRSLDNRSLPILLNTFIETSPLTNILFNIEATPLIQLITRSLFGRRESSKVIELADIVGYDVYPSIGWEFFGKKVYFRPWRDADYNTLVTWRHRAESAGKEVIITEAQAEPWETGEAVHIQKREYPSFNPEAMSEFIDRLVYYGYRDICLWGTEHWLWHRKAGHPEWWDTGIDIMSRHREA